jgi:hypothetical protein
MVGPLSRRGNRNRKLRAGQSTEIAGERFNLVR